MSIFPFNVSNGISLCPFFFPKIEIEESKVGQLLPSLRENGMSKKFENIYLFILISYSLLIDAMNMT